MISLCPEEAITLRTSELFDGYRIFSLNGCSYDRMLNILEVGDIKLNISSYELEGPCNSIKLSLKEFEIIRCFMQRPKTIVTKDELISKIWGYDSDAEYNNIEVYISFLRKKLNYVNSNTGITTVRGVGYKLEEN